MTRRDILLPALASTVPDLNRIVRAFSTAASSWRPAVGQWSARDVLGHFIVTEQVYQSLLQRILTEDHPKVVASPSGMLSNGLVTELSALLSRFTAEREQTLSMLIALRPGEWQRVARHELHGLRSLRYMIQDLVDHDIDHTNQLVQIQSAYRRSISVAAVSVRE